MSAHNPGLAVRPFDPADLEEIVANALGQRELAWHDRRRLARQWGDAPVRGFSVSDQASGRLLFCGGLSEAHAQYARLWAVYAEGITWRQWAFLLDRTRDFIDGLPHRRIDTLVERRAPMALRWANACGLDEEGVLRMAAPDGGDMVIMARLER